MRHKYPSDIHRELFEEKVWPVLQKARKKTKPINVDVYDVFCGILYVLKNGCQWRMLPSDFPKWLDLLRLLAKMERKTKQ